MDILFSEFRKKDVIDVSSGKKLGRIKDLTFSYPEGKIKTVTVSGGMFGCGDELTFKFDKIEKIGEDAILVCNDDRKDNCPPKKPGNNCPPSPCPPERPPCPPERPPFPRFDDGDYE